MAVCAIPVLACIYPLCTYVLWVLALPYTTSLCYFVVLCNDVQSVVDTLWVIPINVQTYKLRLAPSYHSALLGIQLDLAKQNPLSYKKRHLLFVLRPRALEIETIMATACHPTEGAWEWVWAGFMQQNCIRTTVCFQISSYVKIADRAVNRTLGWFWWP